MPRFSAACTSEAVDGPSARRCAKRMYSSRAVGQSQPSGTEPAGRSLSGSSEHRRRERQFARGNAFLALGIFIDDGIEPRAIHAPGLAEGDVLAGDVLQLERHVLEHVAEPGALVLVHAADEAAGFAVGTAVLGEAGQCRNQAVDETLAELARRPGLERAEVELQPDDWKARVVRRADIDGAVEDAHAGRPLPGRV